MLSERDHENKATLVAHKGRLARLKASLASVQVEYTSGESGFSTRNAALAADYQRVTRQYRELQDKFRAFETSDAARYADLTLLHSDEIQGMVGRLRTADDVIATQLLGAPSALPPPPHARDDPMNAAVNEAAAMLGEAYPAHADDAPETPTPSSGGPGAASALSSGGDPGRGSMALLLPASTIGYSHGGSAGSGDSEAGALLPPLAAAKLRAILDAVGERCGPLLLDSEATVHAATLRNAGLLTEARAYSAAAVLRALGCASQASVLSLVAAFDEAGATEGAGSEDAGGAGDFSAFGHEATRGWTIAQPSVGDHTAADTAEGADAAEGPDADGTESHHLTFVLPDTVPIAAVLNLWRDAQQAARSSGARAPFGALNATASMMMMMRRGATGAGAASPTPTLGGGSPTLPAPTSLSSGRTGASMAAPGMLAPGKRGTSQHHLESTAHAGADSEAAYWRSFVEAIPSDRLRLWGALDTALQRHRAELLTRSDLCRDVHALTKANAAKREQLRGKLRDPANGRLLAKPLLEAIIAGTTSSAATGVRTASVAEGEGDPVDEALANPSYAATTTGQAVGSPTRSCRRASRQQQPFLTGINAAPGTAAAASAAPVSMKENRVQVQAPGDHESLGVSCLAVSGRGVTQENAMAR